LIQFRSSDGSVMLYFDPVTKQVWGEDSGNESGSHMDVDGGYQPHEEMSGRNPPIPQDPPMEDFSDEDISAAARIVGMVSPVIPPNASRML